MRPHLTCSAIALILHLCSPAAAQLPANRIGVFDGIVFATGFDEDLQEYYNGATHEIFTLIYQHAGKGAFKSGMGRTRGGFYERRISSKSTLYVNIAENKYKVVTDLYYTDPNAIGGGFGTEIHYTTYGSKLLYNHLIYNNERIFITANVGFGAEVYDKFINHHYGLAKDLNILYAFAREYATFPRFKILKERMKLTFPIGLSTSYNIWKGIYLNLGINYVYVSKSKYFYKDPWEYFEDPLHTAELKIGLSYGF